MTVQRLIGELKRCPMNAQAQVIIDHKDIRYERVFSVMAIQMVREIVVVKNVIPYIGLYLEVLE